MSTVATTEKILAGQCHDCRSTSSMAEQARIEEHKKGRSQGHARGLSKTNYDCVTLVYTRGHGLLGDTAYTNTSPYC